MSLKDKLVALSVAKVTNKIKTNGIVDGAVNSVFNKIGKAVGQKTTAEHLKNTKTNYLIIKTYSFSLVTMASAIINKGKILEGGDSYETTYQITDASDKLRYKSDAKFTITDRDIFDLYDANDCIIGCVKKHLFPIGIPLLEKEVKKCSVYLGKEKISELKKYKSLVDLISDDINFDDIYEGNVTINCKEGNSIKIYYKERLIVTLHEVPLNLKDGYADKFVMEYDNIEDEVIGLLLSIAVDLIKT